MNGKLNSRLVLLSALALMLCPSGHAQEDRAATLRTLADKQVPSKERVALGWQFGTARSAEEVKALQALANDVQQDDDVRFVAIMTLREDPSFRPVIVRILRDPANGGAVLRVKAIHHLGRLRLNPNSGEFRELLDVLRALLKDPRPEVRYQAVSRLVAHKDPAGIQALTDSLREPKDAVATKPQAIELLRIAGPGAHTALIRPYLDDADPNVRREAALALGVDPESRPRIALLLKDKKQPIEVRKAALEGLSLDPGFASYALEIVKDDGEDNDMRLFAVERLAGTPQFSAMAAPDQITFAKVADSIAKSGAPEALTERARIARTALQTTSPAVRDFLKREPK